MKANLSGLAFLLGVALALFSFQSCKPDLTGSISTNATTIYPGKELSDSMIVIVENAGYLRAGEFFVDFVLSSDSLIPVDLAVVSYQFKEDMLFPGGRTSVSSLGPETSLDVTAKLDGKLPNDTPPGDYFIGAVFDPGKKVTESNEQNNVAIFPIRVLDCATLPGVCQPDLYGSIDLLATELTPGKAIGDSLVVILQNGGNVRASGFFIDLVLSSDTTIPIQYAVPSDVFKEDQLLMGGRLSNLAAEPLDSLRLALNATITLPHVIPAGTYYLAAVYDPGQKITESDESNNVVFIPIEIQAVQ